VEIMLMAWELEIHHLDVRGVGDSTIIRVIDTVNAANNRLLLVDGGTSSATNRVHNYITGQFPGTNVNAIIITHYDKDH
jgi:ribonuclease BN (tRNA processing enzyme)